MNIKELEDLKKVAFGLPNEIPHNSYVILRDLIENEIARQSVTHEDIQNAIDALDNDVRHFQDRGMSDYHGEEKTARPNEVGDDYSYEIDLAISALCQMLPPVAVIRIKEKGSRSFLFKCPSCGGIYPYLTKYCPNCGRKLEGKS